jgi:hypothetical protein
MNSDEQVVFKDWNSCCNEEYQATPVEASPAPNPARSWAINGISLGLISESISGCIAMK